ncbi:DUF2190 family protein [Pseudovibrio sp. Tun.PSC04-5.I4]|uniref:DUF2190 family protein n=1 Tax=Pseudovibrio sp. Tun.PSC04-5.I4 TaxID=1798213 RepID=UPI000889032A|nr:DUF2190 family protein [Pseudovibrio sp. Tun.PSC04-5.I4]SDR39924.1 Predicted phage recombinase, RecA/RadA family [Pseudovibrio sp. Tun.PSC04-5.I4]
MKNFISQGNTLTFTNDTGTPIASGSGVLLGIIFGIAAGDIAENTSDILNLLGTYELAKAPSEAWSLGAAVYWDNTAKHCTNVATNNTLIGAAIEAVGGGATDILGKVRLNGSFG